MSEIPSTMRAAVLTERGGPDVLVVRDDVAVPRPAVGEVLIRVSACGVNNTDINTRVGWYSRSVTDGTSGDGFAESQDGDSSWGGGMQFPRIQGADPCGRIVAVGAEVDAARVGERVVVDPWMRDPADPADRSKAGYLGSERDGGFAEFLTVPAINAHAVTRDEIPDVVLAGLACSWSTAFHMLERVDLQAGQRIAVPGASGGVGTALVRLAVLRGAEVTAIAGVAKLNTVAQLGAHHLVDRSTDDVPAAAVAAAGGPLDVVADIVGGDDVVGWLDVLRRGGRYVTSGAIAGPIVDLDLRTLYLNDLELYGATVFEPAVFAGLVELVNTGQVEPMIAATYPLERIHDAQTAFAAKDHTGNIVLTL